MSIRNNTIAVTLLAAALGGMSPADLAGDTSSNREDCSFTTVDGKRPAGHPGKSIRLPQRTQHTLAECPQEQRRTLVLASYTDERGGLSLIRGKADKALEQLAGRKASRKSAYELANQCVAHTLLRQWTDAEKSCDSAIDGAVAVRANAGNGFDVMGRLLDKDVAVAYSNRAVMHLLAGDEVAAHNDLAKARKLSPDSTIVRRNVDAAGRGPALAVVVGRIA